MLFRGVLTVWAACLFSFVASQIDMAANAEGVLNNMMGGGPMIGGKTRI